MAISEITENSNIREEVSGVGERGGGGGIY